MAAERTAAAFPAADGQLQVGFMILKGKFLEMRAQDPEIWTEALIGRLPNFLTDHLRAHRELIVNATLLNVVCGRLEQWSIPGLLLLGDAAHSMSPVGGQGVNLALRDALVAANQLCPVLINGGDAAAIDAATGGVQEERVPEIIAAQKMQADQARMLFSPDGWRSRLLNRLLPLLVRTGLVQRLNRKGYRLMSEGAVLVKLVA